MSDDTPPEDKTEMLDYLDEIRRRIDCGDIVGFSIVALTQTEKVINRTAGRVDEPLFILVEEEMGHVHRREYVGDRHIEDSDRRPALRATEDDEDDD